MGVYLRFSIGAIIIETMEVGFIEVDFIEVGIYLYFIVEDAVVGVIKVGFRLLNKGITKYLVPLIEGCYNLYLRS